MRQVFLLVVIFLLAPWLARRLRRAGQRKAQASRMRRAAPARALPEPMVCCATCGLHVPQSEAVTETGQSFCCRAHARQHAAHSPK